MQEQQACALAEVVRVLPHVVVHEKEGYEVKEGGARGLLLNRGRRQVAR